MTNSFKPKSIPDKQQGLTLIEILAVTAIISIIGMVATPLYQSYKIKAKVGTGVVSIGPIQKQVLEYYSINSIWPADNAEAGAGAPNAYNTNYLVNVELTHSPVPGSIEMTYDSSTLKVLGSNNTLIYYPVVNSGSISWKCDAGTMNDRYRPAHCRT